MSTMLECNNCHGIFEWNEVSHWQTICDHCNQPTTIHRYVPDSWDGEGLQ